MTIAIRELGLADTMMLEELLDQLSPGWTDGLAPEASGPMAFLTQPRSFVFGAYVDNDPVGWIWGGLMFQPSGTRVSHIQQLAVSEEHRRKGIATALFEAAAGLARREGSARIQLVIGAANASGLGFCATLGGARLDHGDVTYTWGLS